MLQSPAPTHHAVPPLCRAALKETAPKDCPPRPKNEAVCCILEQALIGAQEISSKKVTACVGKRCGVNGAKEPLPKTSPNQSMREGAAARQERATAAAAESTTFQPFPSHRPRRCSQERAKISHPSVVLAGRPVLVRPTPGEGGEEMP